MRKWFLSLAVLAWVMSVGGVALADDGLEIPGAIEMKQGMLVKWDSPEGGVDNLTTVTIARTTSLESFGRWNALWDGWTLDFGFAYDANQFNTAALLVGRDFGTLGKYLPIAFPLKDQIEITIYPLGIFADDVFDNPSVHGASGVGVINFEVKF